MHPESLPEPSDELLARLDVPAPRYTSYPTVPLWSEEVGASEHAAALAALGTDPAREVSIYVHLPFCRELCLYCGCNVVVAQDSRVADRYLSQVAREAALVATHLGGRRRISRVHWGGGTPTFLEPHQIQRLWHDLDAAFDLGERRETALEVDPCVTTVEQLATLRSLGFDRISMGVQDFDRDVQEAVNRVQTFAETAALVEAARGLGFRSINLDLIYGLPRQSAATWARTLERVLALAPDRVALFSFAFVPEARPHQRKLPAAELPRGRAKLDLYRQAYARFVAAGMVPVGMDHFARPGDELAVAALAGRVGRDFQGYSAGRTGDTIALGVTGISDVGGVFAQNLRGRAAYAERLLEGRLATERGLRTTAGDRTRAAIIASLLCNFAVDLGPDAERRWTRELGDLGALGGDGLVTIDGGRVEVTPLGRMFVRNVAAIFDAYLGDAAATTSRPVFSRTV